VGAKESSVIVRYREIRSFVLLVIVLSCHQSVLSAGTGTETAAYYQEERVFHSRPNPDREMSFGSIGVTGLKARIYKGVSVRIEGAVPGSPADGKFKPGQIITGVNGEVLKGRNPFVVIGTALTRAEATDGKMIFDVQDSEDQPIVNIEVAIPILGEYSETWPLQCGKSATIIKQAAEYYSTDAAFKKNHLDGKGIGGALACLFLLSTGDDAYIPCVKAYFEPFIKNPGGIGEHTWNNGYNGIACAEYYLRTGDKEVLPVLQYFCDDAKARQKFGWGWVHWGNGIAPRYVAGGLMNPAGCQVLTTLLMSKECGVAVDEQTLLGALRFWYRFAGHGTVPYGDHRPEGGLGSNGKDGMAAAAMLIASGAMGSPAIYRQAKECLAMSMIDSYPVLVSGHADEGRGDAIWRGLASSYLLEAKPGEYHAMMNRLAWWYDLSRRPSGALGNSTCQREGFDDEGTGAAVALSYTASLKTLRITGAPRSRYAKDFTLPEKLWGRPADLAFLSVEDNPNYKSHGAPEPTHIPFWKFGGAYHKPDVDLKNVSRSEMLKNVYHRNYMIRTQAAKALRAVGALDELEKLMQDPDPRVRRAGLDGIVDYNYWFGMGREALKTEALTPGMLVAIKSMLANPEEALWVVDGALMALSLAPAKEIHGCLPLIMPWTTHEDWWLRESAFTALMGMKDDDEWFAEVVPTLLAMMVKEYHTMPRSRFSGMLQSVVRTQKGSSIGSQILAGFMRAVDESEVKTGNRGPEGMYNIQESSKVCLQEAPETAVQIAQSMKARLPMLDAGEIIGLVGSPNSNREGDPFGLYTTLKSLPPDLCQALTELLCNDYRPRLVELLKSDGRNQALIDTILDLAKLKNPEAGWSAVGTPTPAVRTWRFISFSPSPAEVMHPREKKRFRDVAIPEGMENWYSLEFDDSKWTSGKTPIGTGAFKQGNVSYTNNSEWGSGEFLLARSSFELDSVDHDLYRLCVLANQGFHIYLNGKKVGSYVWWKDKPHYRLMSIDSKALREGVNVLAVYCNVAYKNEVPVGQIDVYLEGLRKKDLE